MKTFLFGGVALAALTAATQMRAADLPLPPPAPVPVANWTTCYVGGNVGYGTSLDESITFTGSDEPAFSSTNQFPRQIPVKPKGALAGGQIGCNTQFMQWVFGVESDLQWSDIKATGTVSPIPRAGAGAQFTTTASVSSKWFGTVRGRAGLLVTPQVLFYGTAGLAYGDTELSFSTCSAGSPCASAATSGTNIGWAAGAGLEWMFARNWTVKAEYLYLDLGSRSATGNTNAVPPRVFTAASDQREHVARLGVNYSFQWSP
jgi:outer membrane immunogenic protein